MAAKRQLGNSGIHFAPFALGGNVFGWTADERASFEVLGADNIMWAVDYPYQETVEATQWLNDAPISESDKEKIFHKNAERIFKIPPK